MVRSQAIFAIVLFVLSSAGRNDSAIAKVPQAGAESGTVNGTVMSGGIPMAAALVTLERRDLPGYLAVTDSTGHFAVRGVEAGVYLVRASKRDYLPGYYGGDEAVAVSHLRKGRPLVVDGSEKQFDITIVLHRAGAISGLIRSRDGSPLPSVSVALSTVGRSRIDGRPSLVPVSGAIVSTNLRGEYSLSGLAPGSYVVSVAPMASLDGAAITQVTDDAVRAFLQDVKNRTSPVIDRSRDDSVGYFVTYYPGTVFAEEAVPIEVTEGQQVEAVSLEVGPVVTGRVSGVALLPDGRPLVKALIKAGSDGKYALTPFLTRLRAATGSAGEFVLEGLAPGRYVFETSVSGDAKASSIELWAKATVEVRAALESKVELRCQRTVNLSGRIVTKVASNERVIEPASIKLVLTGADGTTHEANVVAKDEFGFSGLVPGTSYHAALNVASTRQAAPLWGLTFTVNGVDAFDSWFTVGTADTESAELILTDQPGSIDGRLTTADGSPATEYFVLIFPKQAERRSWRTRRIDHTVPAADGHFAFAGLPPGDYLIAVVTGLKDLQWFDQNFLSELVPFSSPVELDGKTVSIVNLKIGDR